MIDYGRRGRGHGRRAYTLPWHIPPNFQRDVLAGDRPPCSSTSTPPA
ncbi:MAG: hypothetical protein LKM39_05570 [Chiayiivirga sp.]|nr:hypothetical protein [Chiayiivirga sp.]